MDLFQDQVVIVSFFLQMQLQFEEMVWIVLKGVYAAGVFGTNKVWLRAACQPHFKLSSLTAIPRGNDHLYVCDTLVPVIGLDAHQHEKWHLLVRVTGCTELSKAANSGSSGSDTVGEPRICYLTS